MWSVYSLHRSTGATGPILLPLARLGLRAGDIVHLRLSDIDWKNASIQVCGKQIRSLVEEISLNRPGPHIKGLHSFTHAARTKLSDADRGTTAAPSSSATGGLAKIKSASRWRVYLARGSPS